MKYCYGGHGDDSERVYWLDESRRPVARMLFKDFSRACKTGDSRDFEQQLKDAGIGVPTVDSLVWQFGQPLIPPTMPSAETLAAITAIAALGEGKPQ